MTQLPTPPTVETVEPGDTTSEWRLTIGSLGASVLACLAAFGLPIGQERQNALLALVGALVTLAGTYSVSRGIRKHGTGG